ncbi:MAG TPA: YicC family protein [Candidatus Marinimicrobia bacterium]|nr:YicC family protein [Candidatus Neomarinimicrobiota bacterium]
MIRSMTGFGKVERQLKSGVLTIEVRSENSRYFDFSIRCPEIFEAREEEIKRRFSSRLLRGRVKVFITMNGSQDEKQHIQLNRKLVDHYRTLLEEANESLGSPEAITLSHLLNFTDIFEVKAPENDAEALQGELFQALEDVIAEVLKMQNAEGAHLAGEIKTHLDLIHDITTQIQQISVQNKQTYFEKVKEKLLLLTGDLNIDESRIIQEAALYSKKIDITEECERLDSHIRQFRTYYDTPEPVGKRMTFLIQEMNREVGTIGAKSESAEVSHHVVEIKNELEKIREQAQNII